MSVCSLYLEYVFAMQGLWTHLDEADPLKKAAHDLQLQSCLKPFDAAGPEMRTQESVLAAAALSERSRFPVKDRRHPSKLHYTKKTPYLSPFLDCSKGEICVSLHLIGFI